MTRKPNFALNAEMKAVAERLTLPAVLVHFFRFARTELEANLDAAGALERYQYWSDKLERLLQQQRSRASHDRH